MSRSVNAKQTALTKKMRSKQNSRDKPRGQSGTHRLKQLNTKVEVNSNEYVLNTKRIGWLSRLFKK